MPLISNVNCQPTLFYGLRATELSSNPVMIYSAISNLEARRCQFNDEIPVLIFHFHLVTNDENMNVHKPWKMAMDLLSKINIPLLSDPIFWIALICFVILLFFKITRQIIGVIVVCGLLYWLFGWAPFKFIWSIIQIPFLIFFGIFEIFWEDILTWILIVAVFIVLPLSLVVIFIKSFWD